MRQSPGKHGGVAGIRCSAGWRLGGLALPVGVGIHAVDVGPLGQVGPSEQVVIRRYHCRDLFGLQSFFELEGLQRHSGLFQEGPHGQDVFADMDRGGQRDESPTLCPWKCP